MMRMIPFEKGKIVFQVLLVVLCQWSTAISQFNLYDTDQRFQNNSLQFDCLNYHIRRETVAYQDLSDVVDEVIPYCFRPESHFPKSFRTFNDSSHQKLSFEELRLANISAQELFSWSTSMEVIERYQAYLDGRNTSSNEDFYNCTPPRFGLRCQYSFEFGEGLSFSEIVKRNFHERKAYYDSTKMTVQVPCYILLKCHRHGQSWCLDWREVCDGNVDCFDEGVDELSCFEMEINECNDDEFQCHNGLCVSQDLWEDGAGETDCLDRSDRTMDISYSESCFQNPTFLCEEHSCRLWINSFACGDGQCVPKFQNCRNGRHVLLQDSMTIQGNLTIKCWTAMVCLTRLRKEVNGTLCAEWLMRNDTAEEALKQYKYYLQFPTVPVHSNHVYFLYKDPYRKLNMNQLLLPDYICYDQQLCDAIIPDFVDENKTCLNASELLKDLDESTYLWDQIMWFIGEYFRVCSISHDIFYEKTKYSNHSSLYNCQHSSKLIPKPWIMDGMRDCPDDDDETYTNSCQLNERYRVTCLNTTNCWSPVAKSQACVLNGFSSINEVRFESFCNGIDEYFYDNDIREHNDEFGCGNWSCDNMYTRCDGYWTCDDGRDEYNCTPTKCPAQTFPCISPVNYTMVCLPSNFVDDSIPNCIGALDEQIICRGGYSSRDISRPFQCSNESDCLQISDVCNQEEDCLAGGDDEDEKLCNNQPFLCDNDVARNRSDIDVIFCGLNEIENLRIKYFSVRTSSNYPPLEEDFADEFTWSTERLPTRDSSLSQVQNNIWPWYCHRGLQMFTWFDNNSNNYKECICPPSYYGPLCQYQNQRISLTLRLSSNDRHATYAVIIMLMDDTDQQNSSHAYDQFVYIAKQSCSMKLNRYLLFPSRPKDISRNYSVRIDVFEKNDLSYVESWHFSIAFLFLPVNRLGIALHLSNHHLQQSSNCFNDCVHGQCVKYVNKANYFCQCFPQWSGIQCDKQLNCQTCSSASICIGLANNQPICVCPIDRYGRQCSLISKCPRDQCQNNGQCIPPDTSIPGSNHTCICTDRFFGVNCQHRKAQLDVSLDDIEIPSYLLAYFFTPSNQSDPIETTVLRKLTLFQRIVAFHIAIPFQLALIQGNGKHYLAVLQQSPKMHITTSINPKQECIPARQIFNSSVMEMISYRRIIHFHWLCYTNYSMTCFMDETYFCLCTNDHHANCMKFNYSRDFTCPLNTYCANGGQCLQDHPTCPSTKVCLCRSCFFGSQCQFYAKSLGSTLDEILGYEFKRNRNLSEQPTRVIVAAILTMGIFLIGFINSILAIITFLQPKAREVGCGIYLLVSSINSLLTMMTIVFKFWFLYYTHQDHEHLRRIEIGNCFGIEMILKVLLCLNNWLNACVAVERTILVIMGINFNKHRSIKGACVMSVILLIVVISLFIPQIIHLHIFNDAAEERSWCVVEYVEWLATYSLVVIFVHYFAPLTINILSIICVIVITTRQRSVTQKDRTIWTHLRSRTKKHSHILISSAIIIALTLPHLVISIKLDCRKSSNEFWFYLIGYFLAFLPAAFIFFIFVLPSSLYRKQFHNYMAYLRRRFEVFRLNL